MKITVVPMLSDNYGYLIVDELSATAACVDPVEPEKVLAAAAAEGVQVVMSLTTHSHWDHAGGNEKIRSLLTDISVIGGKGDGCPGCTKEVTEGDNLQLAGIKISVLSTPCHTPGHVCYVADPGTGNAEDCAVFTGDTMFVGGCGNFNSGTPEQMHSAFIKLGALPDATQVYVGHEYTVNNLKFATFFEPSSQAIKKRLEWAQKRQSDGLPTVPSTIAHEKATNPFMHFSDVQIKETTGTKGDAQTLYAVRKAKDAWGRRSKK